jgi:hypothetical protein
MSLATNIYSDSKAAEWIVIWTICIIYLGAGIISGALITYGVVRARRRYAEWCRWLADHDSNDLRAVALREKQIR